MTGGWLNLQRLSWCPRADARLGVAIVALCLMLAPRAWIATAAAQGTDGPSKRGSAVTRDDAVKERETKQKALSDAQTKASEAKSQVTALAADQERLKGQMIETARQIQALEGRLTRIEANIATLEDKERAERAILESQHDQIAKLLGAMQRMGRNPPPVIITKRDDALAMVRSAMVIARAFPHLRAQADELTNRIDELTKVIAEARAESEKQRVESQRLADAQIRLAALVEANKQSLTTRQGEFDELKKAAQDISREVSDLNVLIERLPKGVTERPPQTAAVRTLDIRPGETSTEPTTTPPAASPGAAPDLSRQQPTSPSTAPLAGPGAQPAAPEPPAQPNQKFAANNSQGDIILRPSLRADVAPQQPLQPRMPFDEARGRLPLPVQGRRIYGFGEKNSSGRRVEGQVWEVRHGGQVTSPTDGWVRYASSFRGFGQLLIISAGNGYYIVLAGLSQIDVQTGQWVSMSEPVGTMAPAPKSGPKDSLPVLYVDFRKDGKPVDPQPWWANAQEKVQG